MGKYHFEDEADKFGETIRIDSITEELKDKVSEKTKEHEQRDLQDIDNLLGSQEDYLNAFQSARVTKMIEEDKDSEDKDSKDKDSKDKDSKDKDSKDKDSKDKDSEDKDSEDKDSEDKDSEDLKKLEEEPEILFLENTQTNNTQSAKKKLVGINKNAQEDSNKIKEKEIKEKEIKEKEIKEKEIKEKEVKEKELKKLLKFGAGIGIIAFCIVFAVTWFFNTEKDENISEPQALETVSEEKYRSVLIVGIADNGDILVYDIEELKNYTLKIDEKTEFIGSDDIALTNRDVEVGQLVFMSFSEEGFHVKKVKTMTDSWELNEATGLVCDITSRTITIPKDTKSDIYALKNETVLLYRGEKMLIKDLLPSDIVNIRGVKDVIWSIDVVKSHGYLRVKNKENIADGFLSVDGLKGIPLADADKISMSEGSHEIVVTGTNIETRKESVFLIAGEEYEIDLSLTQSKTGVLILKSNVMDFKLYINGTLTDATEPVVMKHGDYDIVVLKNGYQSWDKKITISQDSTTLEIDLVEEIQLGDITITTVPSGATIFLNNKEIGVSPILKKLAYGDYNVIIKLDGYEMHSDIIRVSKPSDEIVISMIELLE